MVRTFFICLCLLPPLLHAQSQSYDISYGGTKSGETVSEVTSDGKITSKMSLKIGTLTITSQLDGTVKDGMIVECQIDTSQAGTVTQIKWKGGKYTVVSGGKELVKDQDYKPHLKAAFSAFHPIVNSFLWKGLNGQPTKTKALWMDSLAELEVDFKAKTQVVTTSNGPQTVHFWDVELNGTTMSFAFSPEGSPLGVNVPSQKISWVARGNDGVFADPLAKFPELSQPTFKVKTERRVRMTTRDGVKLMADVSRPEGDGKFPTVLVRTPYGRAASLLSENWLASRGYVVMSQDVRGRGGSDGEWDPLVHERKDGKDTLDWIVSQPWSDGKVGMIGGSYLGYVQWAAATTHHPALKCIIPQVSPPQPDSNFPWDHGSFMLLSDLWWCRVVKDRSSTTAGAFEKLTNLDTLMTLPLTSVDDKFFGENIPFFDKWLRRPTLKDWGDVFSTAEVANVKIPALHISGIWDGDGIGTAIHWGARGSQRPNDMLVFGPWTHLFNSSHKFGDQEYGNHGILELEPLYLRFFDKWLKGKDVKLESQPRVRFFVTGSNKWIDSSSWPIPDARPMSWSLSPNSKFGDLTQTPKVGKASYNYDPNKPEFKLKQVDINVTGDTTVVSLNDSNGTGLVYRTTPFDSATTLAGPMSVEMFVSSTAKDATFVVTVFDIDTKGVARFIGLPGTHRATYVDGAFKPLVPGKPVKVKVQPWWFAHQFAKGHRMAIVVNSDAYPRFARNPGTGEPDWKATRLIKARHTVWSGPKHPSRVHLWKLP